ncbi:MAG: hypothetical protein KY468_11440 [Armatimonadetes bacterium]|nr:hypothetical protein [Armatimonadota bacterium]
MPLSTISITLHDFCKRSILDGEDQRRRYLIQSLLQAEGLSLSGYRTRFGSEVVADMPELLLLQQSGLAAVADGRLRLTEWGLERSDVVGPWLYSEKARERIEAYEWR